MGVKLRVACLMLFAASAVAGEPQRVFMTSVQGTGDLSSWTDAHGNTGLAAADEICRTRAADGGIAESDQYVALISDSTNDAYCRWHGASGTRADNCGEARLPTGAGPLYRMDGLASFDIAENSMPVGDVGNIPRQIEFDEFGAPIPASEQDGQSAAFVSSQTDGTYAGTSCADWTSSTDADKVGLGSAYLGFGNMFGSLWTCDKSLRLLCAHTGRNGVALAREPAPNARLAFFTEASGTGDLSTWPDAAGATGLDAADAVCRASANRAGLEFADSYKAWLSTAATNAGDRFVNDGAIYRVDGVRVAASVAQLSSALLDAPLQLNEQGTFGPYEFENVWTGTDIDGNVAPATCNDWTSDSNSFGGEFGQSYAADSGWTTFYVPLYMGCSQPQHLYCIADNDSLFLDTFDP